eukprot:4514941-Pyramimonas_sp.AAC.1
MSPKPPSTARHRMTPAVLPSSPALHLKTRLGSIRALLSGRLSKKMHLAQMLSSKTMAAATSSDGLDAISTARRSASRSTRY